LPQGGRQHRALRFWIASRSQRPKTGDARGWCWQQRPRTHTPSAGGSRGRGG